MHFHFRNVNDAFKGLVSGIHSGAIPTVRQPSRVGEVLRIEEPVTVTYSHPRERVLFNRARDCNPFFHLFEALWMLAGRDDVAPLVYYNPQMAEYSDDGKTLHGAYGYRWRWHQGDRKRMDQLLTIVANLRENPNCRRQVLSVWNADLDLATPSKDLPCNTHAYFSIRETSRRPASKDYIGWTGDGPIDAVVRPYLDMTVCNRSNDIIWGMLGANVVHWSMLQEYMACRIGVEVGAYHQVTNNAHVYTDRWEPDRWLARYDDGCDEVPLTYGSSVWPPEIPLVKNPDVFDQEVRRFILSDGDWEEPFLEQVAKPMMCAFRRHKRRSYTGEDNNAMVWIERVQASDWRLAGRRWLQKRRDRWNAKNRDGIYTAREAERQAKAGADQA